MLHLDLIAVSSFFLTWQRQGAQIVLKRMEMRILTFSFVFSRKLGKLYDCGRRKIDDRPGESSFQSRRNEMAWLTDDASLLRPPCRSAITP